MGCKSGYRVVFDCLNMESRYWQPVFARSDGSFSTILASVVTYTRPGNERPVKHVKYSKTNYKGC